MARVKGWNPMRYNGELADLAMRELRAAAYIIADKARQNCPVGTITRPIAEKGKQAGKTYSARTPGSLRRSIRVVEKHKEKYGHAVFEERNIRVYAGNYNVYYAAMTEYDSIRAKTPGWMRRSFAQAIGTLKTMFMKKRAA